MPVRKYLSEAIGTFFLVFAGCGAIIVDTITGGAIGVVGIGAVFGLVIASNIFAIGHISGAHMNPAVTLSFLALKKISLKDTISYIFAQVSGAIIASATLLITFGTSYGLGGTKPRPGLESGESMVAAAFLFEFLMTLLLMFVIVSVATDSRAQSAFAAIAIGSVVGLEAIFGGPISGASMNPARSIGPALMGGDMSFLWLYVLAPVIGAITGAKLYQFICSDGPQGRTEEQIIEGN